MENNSCRIQCSQTKDKFSATQYLLGAIGNIPWNDNHMVLFFLISFYQIARQVYNAFFLFQSLKSIYWWVNRRHARFKKFKVVVFAFFSIFMINAQNSKSRSTYTNLFFSKKGRSMVISGQQIWTLHWKVQRREQVFRISVKLLQIIICPGNSDMFR